MDNLQIGVIGTGYVGLVSGVCFADFGYKVICMDVDEKKITKLKSGEIPIYEPGLGEVFERVFKANRIKFTTDIKHTVENSDVIFISVGTPPNEDGSADLKYVFEVAANIGKFINGYKLIVDKSTVPVGTSREVARIISEELEKRNADYEFDVVSNPEFLREGKALYDFTHPDRVVIGSDSNKAIEIMRKIYRPLKINEVPFVITNPETAELIKYASNAFLATKISFINEIANLCEAVGADVHQVAKAMGMDGRISPKFLHPGPGYGGSCFPKDTKAIVDIAQKHGLELKIIKAAIDANDAQKFRMVKKIKRRLGDDLSGKTIAILGLTFKAETDDTRESAALIIIPELIKSGASIKAFDPKGISEMRWRLADYSDKITYTFDEYEACKGTDALVILTEWPQFRKLDLLMLSKTMKQLNFFDTRNLYRREEVESLGFYYEGIGR